MDEYDERLVAWFDREFWPMVARELADAERTASESTVSRVYWEGYLDAIDKVSRYIDEGMERIKAAVEEEDSDD